MRAKVTVCRVAVWFLKPCELQNTVCNKRAHGQACRTHGVRMDRAMLLPSANGALLVGSTGSRGAPRRRGDRMKFRVQVCALALLCRGSRRPAPRSVVRYARSRQGAVPGCLSIERGCHAAVRSRASQAEAALMLRSNETPHRARRRCLDRRLAPPSAVRQSVKRRDLPRL